MWSSFWNGDKNWQGYKGTLILLTSGIVKAFLDNYWVLTSTPLSASTDPTATPEDQFWAKLFYMPSQIIFTSILYGGVGYTIDLLRSIYHGVFNEENPLLPRRQF